MAIELDQSVWSSEIRHSLSQYGVNVKQRCRNTWR